MRDMIINNSTWEGLLLRSERIRQNKGQKEICIGLCVPSYLCKIEKGQALAPKELLVELFKRLNISYETDAEFLEKCDLEINEFFQKFLYGLEYEQITESLFAVEKRLLYSSHRISYLLMKGLTGDSSVIPALREISFGLNREQEAYYYLLEGIHSDSKEERLSFYKKANEGMRHSCFMVFLASVYLENSDYTAIHNLESRLVTTALEEGNVYSIAEYYLLNGTAYGSLDLEEMMLVYYNRAIKMCENTGWKHIQNDAYYNIGSVYLCQNRFAEAKEYLDKVEKENFMLLHKKALLSLRSGRMVEGKNILERMKPYLEAEESHVAQILYEEACMELEEDYINNPEYELLLDRLIAVLKEHRHFGFLYSFKDVIIRTYVAQRKYKKALEFQNEISNRIIHK